MCRRGWRLRSGCPRRIRGFGETLHNFSFMLAAKIGLWQASVPETRLLRWRSAIVRSSKNTSASSMRSTRSNSLLESSLTARKARTAIPKFAQVENGLQIFLYLICFRSNITASDSVERFLGKLGDTVVHWLTQAHASFTSLQRSHFAIDSFVLTFLSLMLALNSEKLSQKVTYLQSGFYQHLGCRARE